MVASVCWLTFRRDALLDLALVHNGLRIDRNALYGGGFSQNLHIRVVDLATVGRDERVARLQRRRLLHIEIVIEYLHIQQPHAYQPEPISANSTVSPRIRVRI